MITIASIGDMHWWKKNRWQETLRIASWTIGDLTARKPDVITVAGDIFETAAALEERNAFGEWLDAARAVAPVYGIYGNHDRDLEMELYNLIPGVHFSRSPEGFDVPGLALRLEMLPWPRKANLLASVEHALAPEDTDALAVEHLRNVLTSMSRTHTFIGRVCAKVMVAHAMVRDSRTSVGQPVRGAELTIGLEDLALARCHAYLLGHIHMPQEWVVRSDDLEAPVIYTGSWRRTTYGETEDKGYVLMRLVHRGEHATPAKAWNVEWERITTPCAAMHLFEARWDGARFVDVVVDSGATHATEPCIPTENAAGWEGAEIRFRYTVDADQRPAAKAAADRAKKLWLESGAADVQFDPQTNPQSRARMPEIATEQTTAGKMRALWRLRAEAPDPERQARLLEKLSSLEGGTNVDHGHG